MGRIKLEMPKAFPFDTVLSVRVSDLNYGNHLGNDRVLTLIHEARMRYLAHYGYKELDAEGVGFLQGDCAIVYKSEGFWGDQLRIRVAAGDYSRVGLDFFFRIEMARDGRILADGKTGLVCYDFEAQKVVSVPVRLRETLGDAMEMQKEGV